MCVPINFFFQALYFGWFYFIILISNLSPILDVVLGSSSSSMDGPKLSMYPLFDPIKTCFMSANFAPFTVVLNKNMNQASGRTFGFSNILQCLVQPIITPTPLQTLPTGSGTELIERTAASAINLATGALSGILLS